MEAGFIVAYFVDEIKQFEKISLFAWQKGTALCRIEGTRELKTIKIDALSGVK